MRAPTLPLRVSATPLSAVLLALCVGGAFVRPGSVYGAKGATTQQDTRAPQSPQVQLAEAALQSAAEGPVPWHRVALMLPGSLARGGKQMAVRVGAPFRTVPGFATGLGLGYAIFEFAHYLPPTAQAAAALGVAAWEGGPHVRGGIVQFRRARLLGDAGGAKEGLTNALSGAWSGIYSGVTTALGWNLHTAGSEQAASAAQLAGQGTQAVTSAEKAAGVLLLNDFIVLGTTKIVKKVNSLFAAIGTGARSAAAQTGAIASKAISTSGATLTTYRAGANRALSAVSDTLNEGGNRARQGIVDAHIRAEQRVADVVDAGRNLGTETVRAAESTWTNLHRRHAVAAAVAGTLSISPAMTLAPIKAIPKAPGGKAALTTGAPRWRGPGYGAAIIGSR